VSETDREAAPAAVPPRSFGEELRRERELRQITLREVAEATKISLRFLEALENNDFDVLPGGFFTRGFIKSYARHIGVNEEAMVNAYLMELNQQRGRTSAAAAAPAPAVAPVPTPAPRAAAASARAAGGGARSVTVAASLLAFFGLAFLLWNGVRQLGQGAAQAPEPIPEPVSEPVGAPASEPAPAAVTHPESLLVGITVRERAWVRLLCDGREMVNRTLDPGSYRRFECRDEVSISASDPRAVEVEINGRPMALPGTPGQRVTPVVVRRQEWPPTAAPAPAEEHP
jgi:hypothetical protein